VMRVAVLPESAEVQKMQREQYLLDSAHHGLAMDPGGTKLCVAGTMDGYAAIVSRTSFDYTMAAHGHVPYWATNSTDGKYCFVSFAGDDQVSAISYATGQQVARINVGDHPQRMRMGVIRREFLPAG
jgi:DNA-binding beta-propeller fold protein YncE